MKPGAISPRPPGPQLDAVLRVLRAAGPAGLTVREIAQRTGRPAQLIWVLMITYRDLGHVASVGQRPHTRWIVSAVRAHRVALDAWQRAEQQRQRILGLLHDLLLREGTTLAAVIALPPPAPELVPDDTAAALAAVQQAIRGRSAPPPPAPRPKAPRAVKPAAYARPRSAVPAPVTVQRAARDTREVVVPADVRVTVCPSGQDTRYAVDPRAPGLGLRAEWRRLRGER